MHGYIDGMCFNPVFSKMQEIKVMIREFQMSDTAQVMKLWLSGNIDAHSFVPEKYWRSHFGEVQEALLQAKVFVCDIDGNIKGFIGLMNEYIAGIFVDKNCRSTGIGTQLLTYVKEKYDILSLPRQVTKIVLKTFENQGFFQNPT